MAILDALFYVISADNSKLNKEVDKSEKKVDTFTEQMKTAEGRAKIMEDKIKGAFTRVGAAILATVAASKALQTFNERVDLVEQIQNTSDALGVAIEDVDAFGKAIERMGGDAQGARDTLTDMAESIGEALQDMESGRAKTFKRLGISLKDTQGQAKNAVGVMHELAGAVEGMSREEAVFRIKELGITDNRSVELILKGRQELERMLRTQKEQGVITKESAERVRAYSESMARLRQSMGVATGGIVDWMLPALTRLVAALDSVVSWMNRHETFIKAFFLGITSILTVMFLPAAISAAGAVWALIAPFLAVAAPILAVGAAFALVYDDIANFMEGNDSLIGQISETYPLVGQHVRAMVSLASAAFNWLIGDTEAASQSLSVFTDYMKMLADRVTGSLKSAFGAVSSYLDQVWAHISGIFENVASVVKRIGKWLGFGGSEDIQITATTVGKGIAGAEAQAAENMRVAQAAMGDAAANPLNSVTSNAISNASNTTNETNVQVGQVTVQTQATDAQGIARDVGGELRDQMKNVQSDAASGRAR
ncbi:FIG00948920: hypothetical protein [plant metagenome]|uniref:Phage tail length tape-measure protein n=1 Tax=plant metagenome TaxID=1297885 RepID=A0A484QLV7_9ZZZZ